MLGNQRNTDWQPKNIDVPSGNFEMRNSDSAIARYERIWKAIRMDPENQSLV